MANVDKPQGGQYRSFQSGTSFNGGLTPYLVPASDATALFVGDPVLKTGTSNSARVTVAGATFEVGTLPTAVKSSATGKITGFIAVVAAEEPSSKTFREASTQRVIYVTDDPNAIFEIQGDSATASAITDVGNNADMVFTHAGSTATGLSGVELDVSTIATTATLNLKIVGFAENLDNDPTTANAKYLVKINQATQAANTAGI